MALPTQKSLDLEISEPPTSPPTINLISPKSNDSSTDASKSRRKRKPKKVLATANTSSDFNSDFSSSPVVNSQISVLATNEQKFDSDGCETIDKIAQMVSNITRTADPPLLSPPKLPEQTIKDVEVQLEEMFAETNPLPASLPPPIINMEIESHQNEVEVSKSTQESKPKKPRKKKPIAQKKQSKVNAVNESKTKNAKKEKKGSGGRAKVKNDAAPYLQVQEDGTFQIINQTTNGEDDAEKSNTKPKKLTERHKNIARRVHVSADKRDSSWVCVFCKFEPHKFKLGDLFGPYIINTTSPEYSLCLEDPLNDIFKQGNQNKFAPVTHSAISPSPTKKKGKNNEAKVASTLLSATPVTDTSVEVFNGMSKIDETHYEIWFHEDCIAWAPGTYIIGSKINNLESAVWNSTRHRCTVCQKNGAMMACLHRGCKKEAHYACARKNWKLCDDFKTFCDQHHTNEQK